MADEIAWKEFAERRIESDHGQIFVRFAGAGRPLLLLHGFPQTGYAFRKMAPQLAKKFLVVVPDLPGYGDSLGPLADENGAPYDKRSIARSMISLMANFGASQFLVAGHDRGARVAYRMALDEPEKVSALVSLDTVPTISVWDTMDYNAAISAFHWPLLAQPASIAVNTIHAASDSLIGHFLSHWAHYPLDADAIDVYLAAYRRREVCEGACADYRAGATLDLQHDRQDAASGRKLQCKMLVPYGTQHTTASLALDWRVFANNVEVAPIDCGHFLAEEAPEQTLELMERFFAEV